MQGSVKYARHGCDNHECGSHECGRMSMITMARHGCDNNTRAIQK